MGTRDGLFVFSEFRSWTSIYGPWSGPAPGGGCALCAGKDIAGGIGLVSGVVILRIGLYLMVFVDKTHENIADSITVECCTLHSS